MVKSQNWKDSICGVIVISQVIELFGGFAAPGWSGTGIGLSRMGAGLFTGCPIRRLN
jgi:hypothetical protein